MLKNVKKLDRNNLKKIKGGANNRGYCPDNDGYFIPCRDVCSNGSSPICGFE